MTDDQFYETFSKVAVVCVGSVLVCGAAILVIIAIKFAVSLIVG